MRIVELKTLVFASALCFGLVAKGETTLTTLVSFSWTNGALPESTLVQGVDGNFYGTTQSGGTNELFDRAGGTVFRMVPDGNLITLISFEPYAYPAAGLVQGSDGDFYGTTLQGGPYYKGTIFRISTTGILNVLYTFGSKTNAVGNSLDGAGPAGLLQAADGNFYGLVAGGAADGAVFRMSSQGAFSILHSFSGGTDGASPGALVQGSDGSIFGATTWPGGIFKIATNDTFTPLAAMPFPGYISMLQCSGGNFLGTTSGGVTNTNGTIFTMSAQGQVTSLVSFTGTNDPTLGRSPQGGLMQGNDGNFYGTTYLGGTSNLGTVFQLTPEGKLTSLVSFNGQNGANPASGLVQAADGYLYGTTLYGGSSYGQSAGTGLVDRGFGTIFRLNIPISPLIRSISREGNAMKITWASAKGQRYQLQSRSDLIRENWTDVGSPVVADGQASSASDPIVSGAQRYYRVLRTQ